MRHKILALPVGVNLEDIDWEPTQAERDRDKYLLEKAEFERKWMEEALKHVALIACLIKQDERDAALEEFHQRRQAFYQEQAEKQAIEDHRQIAAHLALMQAALDKNTYDALVARLEKAGREIKRDAAELEKNELKRRGVYRGR